MNENPEVEITELRHLPGGSFEPKIVLGLSSDRKAVIQSITLSGLVQRFAEQAKSIFLLEWQGGATPRGAVIDGKTISWTRHGIVRDNQGEEIGIYKRIVEFGGQDSNEQKMLVLVF